MKKVIKFKDRTLLKAEKIGEESSIIFPKVMDLLMPNEGVDTLEEVFYFVMKTNILAIDLINTLGEVSNCPDFDKSAKKHFTHQVSGLLDGIEDSLKEARAKNNA